MTQHAPRSRHCPWGEAPQTQPSHYSCQSAGGEGTGCGAGGQRTTTGPQAAGGQARRPWETESDRTVPMGSASHAPEREPCQPEWAWRLRTRHTGHTSHHTHTHSITRSAATPRADPPGQRADNRQRAPRRLSAHRTPKAASRSGRVSFREKPRSRSAGPAAARWGSVEPGPALHVGDRSTRPVRGQRHAPSQTFHVTMRKRSQVCPDLGHVTGSVPKLRGKLRRAVLSLKLMQLTWERPLPTCYLML